MRRISAAVLSKVSLFLLFAVILVVFAARVALRFATSPPALQRRSVGHVAVDPTNPHGFISIGVIDPHLQPRASELLTDHGIDSAIDGSVAYNVAVRPKDALRATALLKSDPQISPQFESTLR